jgi:hypothetical protein
VFRGKRDTLDCQHHCNFPFRFSRLGISDEDACLHFASAFPTLTSHVAVEKSPTMNDQNPRDPGRNLLFGLLAFHNNFIYRRALVAAFDVWTTDKSQPFGRLLVRQGAIAGELHVLFGGLVSAHLVRHDHEPPGAMAR